MDFIQAKTHKLKELVKAIPHLQTLLQVLGGSVFLSLMAQVAVSVPLTPVPITLHTLGVSLLTLTLGGKKAFYAILAYLVQATLGLPVLAFGIANPLWMLTPRTGYFLAFLLSSLLLGKVVQQQEGKSFFVKYVSLFFCADFLICSLGACYLALFVGFEQAFFLGFLPFLPGGLAKALVATSAIKPIAWIKNYLS